ncbi:hypothetical protein GE09DRAFT_1117412 [Coniochaeta sp. 2T2.1]|nr:hypothetical protein GE09DRAFT_1117412 [Coniochaeta sp. 2T2.1]
MRFGRTRLLSLHFSLHRSMLSCYLSIGNHQLERTRSIEKPHGERQNNLSGSTRPQVFTRTTHHGAQHHSTRPHITRH